MQYMINMQITVTKNWNRIHEQNIYSKMRPHNFTVMTDSANLTGHNNYRTSHLTIKIIIYILTLKFTTCIQLTYQYRWGVNMLSWYPSAPIRWNVSLFSQYTHNEYQLYIGLRK